MNTNYQTIRQYQRDNYWDLYKQANTLRERGYDQEAVSWYDKALEHQPADYWAWYNRGIALDEMGRHQDAMTSYDPARALQQLGDYRAALASYRQSLNLDPTDSEAWYGQACCYALQGDKELALTHLQKALELSPEECRQLAGTASEFDHLRASQEFQKLMQSGIESCLDS